MHLGNLDVCITLKVRYAFYVKFTKHVFKIAKFVSIESVCLKIIVSIHKLEYLYTKFAFKLRCSFLNSHLVHKLSWW